ncbi:hypothetical protein E2562_028486 [Oryza meyeriana var. granulata]|uniref:Uncharacterized protein n=1 Tax=Oryza meyeriana var. granulata TaxID=110450 RepID=A0A6G1DQN0_9ORYZ|nr:hypothetical protein E2562_028486 [Oryza meyeriana var. granulata]
MGRLEDGVEKEVVEAAAWGGHRWASRIPDFVGLTAARSRWPRFLPKEASPVKAHQASKPTLSSAHPNASIHARPARWPAGASRASASLADVESLVRENAGRQLVSIHAVDAVRNAPAMLSLLKPLKDD